MLACRYYDLTGKPLGITGEVAEYEAAMKLNLCLHPPRQAGYDATEVRQEGEVKTQIKGLASPTPKKYRAAWDLSICGKPSIPCSWCY